MSRVSQFSLRSRTPSVNGSYCSPYSSLTRKVRFILHFLFIFYFYIPYAKYYSYTLSSLLRNFQHDMRIFQYGYRAVSPGLTLREYRSSEGSPHRITTYSYLASEPSTLRRCVQPSDRPPASPHFHRPPSAGGTRSSSRAASKASSRPGMRALVDSIRSETPRPRSPHLNNDEPIELASYPAAYKPPPGTLPKIERDDFPAPPYPYTDPGQCSDTYIHVQTYTHAHAYQNNHTHTRTITCHGVAERRRRWSDTYKGVPDSDDETDRVNGHDDRLRKEEQELAKIDTGIAQVIMRHTTDILYWVFIDCKTKC